MSDYVYKIKICQVIASICVAVFIVDFAFCLMCGSKFVYNRIYMQEGVQLMTEDDEDEPLTDFEAQVIFSQLSDDFTTFFKSDYDIAGYELTQDNLRFLKEMKGYYRRAVVMVILSVGGFVYCYVELSKRRELGPLLYGSALACFLLALRILFITIAKKGIRYYLQLMILRRDYSVFGEGDVLSKLFPADYARGMAVVYVGYALILTLGVLIVRKLIIKAGKPHKF